MTGLSAVVSTAGVLTISGTPTNSTYQINETSSQISVAGVSGSFADSKVKSIVVNLDGGNDTVLLNKCLGQRANRAECRRDSQLGRRQRRCPTGEQY